MGITNQLTVDPVTGEGIRRTWREHVHKGMSRYTMTVERVPLSDERRKELIAVHERVIENDRKIRMGII